MKHPDAGPAHKFEMRSCRDGSEKIPSYLARSIGRMAINIYAVSNPNAK